MTDELSGDRLAQVLTALSSPLRMRILATLHEHQMYVSELARELGISRPLLHMHLQRMEAAGLLIGHHDVSADGKALRYYRVIDFREDLTPDRIARAVKTLSVTGDDS